MRGGGQYKVLGAIVWKDPGLGLLSRLALPLVPAGAGEGRMEGWVSMLTHPLPGKVVAAPLLVVMVSI